MDNFQSSEWIKVLISCNKNMTISLHFSEDPHLIWSSNHKEIWIFVKQVTGPFVPSFAIRMYMAFTDTLRSQHTDLQTFKIVCIPFQQRLILTT